MVYGQFTEAWALSPPALNRVKAGVVVSYNQLVFAPVLSQMIESFTEIADLIGFIVWVVNKCDR